jgi:hypothetical protein
VLDDRHRLGDRLALQLGADLELLAGVRQAHEQVTAGRDTQLEVVAVDLGAGRDLVVEGGRDLPRTCAELLPGDALDDRGRGPAERDAERQRGDRDGEEDRQEDAAVHVSRCLSPC